MHRVYNTDTHEIVEIDTSTDINELMYNYLVPMTQPFIDEGDTEWFHALPTEEIEWWELWAERQEAVDAAYEDADEETQLRVQTEPEWSDLGAAQDEAIRILGLTGLPYLP